MCLHFFLFLRAPNVAEGSAAGAAVKYTMRKLPVLFTRVGDLIRGFEGQCNDNARIIRGYMHIGLKELFPEAYSDETK